MEYANKLKIIQHNVLKWPNPRRHELSNYYRKEDADIILLNSTGIPDTDRIKMFGYNIYQKTLREEIMPA